MNERAYVKTVAKRLACSKARRDEFVRDLASDIASARAAGEPWEQIERRMGDPRQVAAEFNEDLPDEERAAGKRRKRLKIAAVAAGVVVAFVAVIAAAVWWVTPHQGPVEQTTDADATVALAQEAVAFFGEQDYDGLRSIASEAAADVMTDALLEQSHAAIAGGDWGALESFGNAYKAEVVQMGQSGVAVQLVAVYENATLNFMVAFDDEGKLTGLRVV